MPDTWWIEVIWSAVLITHSWSYLQWDSPTRSVVIWGHWICCPDHTWFDKHSVIFPYQICGDFRSFDLLSSSYMVGHTFSEIPLLDLWWFEVIWSAVLITHVWSYLQWDSPTRPVMIWGHLICCPHHAWLVISLVRTRHNNAHQWIFT